MKIIEIRGTQCSKDGSAVEKVVQKMNLHFWLEFRKWLDLFPASYGATPQLQLNISDISSWCRVALKKMINLPSGFPFSVHANFGSFTLLFCKLSILSSHGLHVRCAFIEIWSTREIWKTWQMLKSSSVRVRKFSLPRNVHAYVISVCTWLDDSEVREVQFLLVFNSYIYMFWRNFDKFDSFTLSCS